ncbi:hypothetical protein Tco_1265576 [Tanacetum coccineum]
MVEALSHITKLEVGTSVEDLKTTVCFLDCQEIKLWPRKSAYAVTDLLVVAQLAQSLSHEMTLDCGSIDWVLELQMRNQACSKAYFLYVNAKLVEFPRNSIPSSISSISNSSEVMVPLPYRDLVSLRTVLGVVLDFYGDKTFDCDHLCHWGKGFFEIYSYLMNKTFCHKSGFKSLNATICIEFDSKYTFTTNAYFAEAYFLYSYNGEVKLMSIWEAFRGYTRDLDSIWEETGQDCNFTQRRSKMCVQCLETASELLATPSELASDDVNIFVSERNRLKKALEDLAKRWRQDYKATLSRSFFYIYKLVLRVLGVKLLGYELYT